MKVGTLAIVVREGQVLLGQKYAKAKIGPGTLNAPGGDQEEQETLLECILRELEEEVGISADPARAEEVAVVTFCVGDEPDYEGHIFYITDFDGEPGDTDTMHDVGWYDIDDLPLDRMLESDAKLFPRIASGESFNARVRYQERAKGFIDIEFGAYEG